MVADMGEAFIFVIDETIPQPLGFNSEITPP
jgi:hypothetical protein